LGINTAHIKLIPEVLKKRGMKGVHSLIILSIKPLIISLLLFSIVFLVLSSQISTLLKIPHDAMYLNIFSIISFALFTFFGSVLYSLQKMRWYFKTEFFQFLFRIVFGVIFLFLGLKYLGLLFGFFLSYLLFLLLRLDINYFKGSEKSLSYRKLFNYAFPALITTIAWALITNGQYVLLTALKGTEVTGTFAVAFISTSIIGMIPSVLTSALLPIISDLSTDRNTKDKQNHLIYLVLRYALFLTFPIVVLWFIFPKYIVLFMSKPEFIESASYFSMLVPASALYGLGIIFLNSIYIIGYPKKSRNISIVTSLFFLLVSIPLINYFSAAGLSFAYLMSMALFFVMSFIVLKKLIKIKFPFNDFKKIVLASLTISLLLYLLRPFVNSFFWIIPFGIISAAFYLSVLLWLRFYRIEDIKILEFLSDHLPLGKYLLPIINFLKNKIKK
jgi:O-antigen/teichoic acid export membrane protein